MKKEYISFGIIGIALGLILGFFVANMRYKNPVAGQQPAASGNQGSASVNPGPSQELPANHPPIDSGQTIPAPPLPNTPATGAPATGGSATGEPASASGSPTSGAATSGAAT